MDLYRETLEIDAPMAECGWCGYGQRLSGTWTVEDGRLVFRAHLDPLMRRGPGYSSCSESDHGGNGAISFTRVTVDGEPLTDGQVAELQAAAASPEAQAEEEAR